MSAVSGVTSKNKTSEELYEKQQSSKINLFIFSKIQLIHTSQTENSLWLAFIHFPHTSSSYKELQHSLKMFLLQIETSVHCEHITVSCCKQFSMQTVDRDQ